MKGENLALFGQDELSLPGGLEAVHRAVMDDFDLLAALEKLLAANGSQGGGGRRWLGGWLACNSGGAGMRRGHG